MIGTHFENPPRHGEVAVPQGLTEGAHLSSKAAFAARWDPSVASRHLPETSSGRI